MKARTTIQTEREILEILRQEAHRQNISLGKMVTDILTQHVTELRKQLPPRLGLFCSEGTPLSYESATDEDSPASTPPVS